MDSIRWQVCVLVLFLRPLRVVATCLSQTVSTRRNVTVDEISMPLGIWVNDWDSARIVAEVYAILAEEILGYNVYKDLGSQSSLQLQKLAGCEHNRSNNEILGACDLPRRFHVGLENWVTQEENIEFFREMFGQRAPRPIGEIGYVGVEGMYVLGPARQRALGASGLALEHHRSYNSSWHEPQKYTATVADIGLDLLRSCADSIEQSWGLLGEQYLAQTGDVEGTEVKNGTIVLKCWQGKWWAAPSCRQNVSECTAIVTGGSGWGMTEMPQQAFFWNMPLAFATAAQAPVSQYYPLNKQLQSLLYWWAPDTMFAVDDPNMIIFPKNNAREYAAGLYRTAKDRAILSNWVAGGLGRSDIRDAMQLVRKLHFTDEAMRSLLVDFSTFNGSAADTACAWVRMHRHVWKDWLPNATLCNPGYGLVDQNSSFVTRGRAPEAVGCRPCHPGRYSETYEATRICSPCSAGRHQPSAATAVCLPCPLGTMADKEGADLCDLCPLGYYANRSGAQGCDACTNKSSEKPFWTTIRFLASRGEWIPTQGAVSSSFCSCTDGFALHSGSCHRCLPGTRCRNNEVRLEPGYWSPSSSPFLVFRCSVADRCPGGEPGCCREGRDPDSVACFRCMPGLHDSSGTCRRCGMQEYAWVVACMMLCVLGLMALYAVNLAARDVRHAGPGSLLMAALGLGQMVTLVQQLLIIQQFQIDWVEPFRSIMAALQIVAFDLDALRLGCMAPAGSLSNFLCRTFVLPTFCIIAAIIHLLYANFFHTPCWQKRTDVSSPSRKPEMTLLFSTVGTLWLVFFISHGATILAPFRCTEHPSGQLTVQGYEDVICNYGGVHLSMLLIGSINCVLPIGFLAACVWVLCAELPKRIMIADMKFVRACAFLLLRFRPGQGTVTALYLVRNMLVLMCPLLPTAAGKVLSMDLLLYVSLLLTASGKPWRNMTCNFLDIGLVSGMLILLDMGSLSVQERQTQTTTAIATVSFSLMTSAALFASAFGIIRYFWMKFKKPFNFFLCHHKVATGSYARLLKMELDKYGFRSFIDCDDLQDLSRLFGYVSHGTETMVIFGSRDVFTRKWCLGEIVTARIHEVQTVLLSFPGFTAPDKDFIASLTKTFPEVLDLVSHRMGVKEIEDTLVWIPSLEAINVDRQVSPASVAEVVSHLAGDHHRRLVSKRVALPECLILADLDTTEAAAAAFVLHGFLVPLALKKNSAVMPEVHLGRHLPVDLKAIFLVCSDQCFENPMYASWLWQLRGLEECAVVPVVVSAQFRFPALSFYEDIVKCPQLQVLGIDLREYAQIAQVLFGELWSFVTFLPQSSSSSELQMRAEQAQRLLAATPAFVSRLRAAAAIEDAEDSETCSEQAGKYGAVFEAVEEPMKREASLRSLDMQFMAEIYQMYFCPMTSEEL